MAAGVNVESFTNWAIRERAHPFMIQNLVDCRLEPRWQFGFGMEGQIKNEFAGRLLNIAQLHEETLESMGFNNVFGDSALTVSRAVLKGCLHHCRAHWRAGSIHRYRWMTKWASAIRSDIEAERVTAGIVHPTSKHLFLGQNR